MTTANAIPDFAPDLPNLAQLIYDVGEQYLDRRDEPDDQVGELLEQNAELARTAARIFNTVTEPLRAELDEERMLRLFEAISTKHLLQDFLSIATDETAIAVARELRERVELRAINSEAVELVTDLQDRMALVGGVLERFVKQARPPMLPTGAVLAASADRFDVEFSRYFVAHICLFSAAWINRPWPGRTVGLLWSEGRKALMNMVAILGLMPEELARLDTPRDRRLAAVGPDPVADEKLAAAMGL